MTHAIHETEGIIIDSSEFGEAGRILSVLTPHYGILSLFAQGVREGKSKMRGSLSVGTVGTFEFVEGREVRRLTGVFQKSLYQKVFTSLARRDVYFHVVSFLKRVLVGEVEATHLYGRFLEGLSLLESQERLDELDITDLEVLEMVMVINILAQLGYWSHQRHTEYSKENFKEVLENKESIAKEISNSIKSTHL